MSAMSSSATAQDVARQSSASGFAATFKLGGDKSPDFSKPFLPENLVRTASLDFVNSHAKHMFNQLRGHAYLCIFSLPRAPCRRRERT